MPASLELPLEGWQVHAERCSERGVPIFGRREALEVVDERREAMRVDEQLRRNERQRVERQIDAALRVDPLREGGQLAKGRGRGTEPHSCQRSQHRIPHRLE